MATPNLNTNLGRHREGSSPHLQVSRRSSGARAPGIPRISVSPSGTSFLATQSATRPVTNDVLSTSAPSSVDAFPVLPQSARSQKAKAVRASQSSHIPSSGSTDSTRKPSSRLRSSTSTPLPTTAPRLPHTRSFLLAAGSGNGVSGSAGKALGTMSPLPKHHRTSKTSQKLVVLPSAPQTKPLSKQLVLLNEELESSDDSAHPHGILPPRRAPVSRKPFSKVVPIRHKVQEEEVEEEDAKERMPTGTGEDSQPPAQMRIRDYKSSAERMTKEERKQAGYRRMTAYCIAEGLKMKVLAGFLKREHNVLPRVFDEALYVMYHLPLLPGYGPSTNVRSSAPPAIEIPSSTTTTGFTKSILTRLEEAEENGYLGSYFPQAQDLINLEDNTNDSHRNSPSQANDGFTTEGGGPDDSASTLPGWVRPPEVDEVREHDGYVTSSSLPRDGVADGLISDGYEYGYQHYPTSSSAVSTPSTLRKHDLALQPSEPNDLENFDNDTTPPYSARTAEPNTASTSRDLAEGYYADSGLETDDPGIQTDPGVYGSPASPIPQGRINKVHFAQPAASSVRNLRTENEEAGNEQEGDMAASTLTTIPPQQNHESSAAEISVSASSHEPTAIDTESPPKPSLLARANTLAVLQGVAANVNTTGIISHNLVQDELHDEDVPVASAYERQLAYERERDQGMEEREELVELERERHRQLEYEQALEREQERERERQLDDVGEAVFFEYGVVVFFGLTEREERDILDDIEQAGVVRRPISEEEFEVEECHFAHDPNISYPRIYNDFFTLKSRSHLLKLSIAHALAQSTLLARYETLAQRTLSSPLTLSIPRQLASSGSLQLRRHEALKLTGRLFKLRRDVNLVSNVLDVPELFWSEASLKDLYDAVREYMEIGPRVDNLNEKLGVASDFLDAIHDHLNNNAMERITWIIIWLIVVAVLVELGEIIARLVVHAGIEKEHAALSGALSVCSAATSSLGLNGAGSGATPLSKEEVLRTLEMMMNVQMPLS